MGILLENKELYTLRLKKTQVACANWGLIVELKHNIIYKMKLPTLLKLQ